MNKSFHAMTAEDTLADLGSDPAGGLTGHEAAERLKQYGHNRLLSAKRRSMLLRILDQFKDFLVLILIAAAIISVAAGDGLKDAIIIVAILIVNMIIGITQENKADDALKELKNMSSPKAKVKRDGVILKIDSEDVAIGDIIYLDAGDYVPADIRIIESMNLRIDESALTGESVPVGKDAQAVLDKDIPLGDRINLASMSTMVTYGRGAGDVHTDGMGT